MSLMPPPSDMMIRPVRESDFGAIARLTNHYIEKTCVHFGLQPVTAEELAEAWTLTRDMYPYLVAEVGGGFAAYAKAGTWRERAAYRWTAEVGIYAESAVHGRGVGRALYTALIETAKDWGFHSVIGGITLPNAASVRLHESLGFLSVGTVREAGWKMGAWRDVAFYQLMLREPTHIAGPIGA